MDRAGPAAQVLGKMVQRDTGLVVWPVHFVFIRKENSCYACLLCQIQVIANIAGIGVQVFIGAKLGRIDKNAQDQLITQRFAYFKQRNMSFVKVSHGGYKTDGLSLSFFCSRPGLHIRFCF